MELPRETSRMFDATHAFSGYIEEIARQSLLAKMLDSGQTIGNGRCKS